MGKIDTSGWKEFSVCELFGKSRLGKYHSPESLVESETGYPYICASNQNNGINQKMSLVSGDDVRPTPQNIISWGKQCPYLTFHEEPCVTGQGMYYIVIPKYIPRRAIRYVITVLQSTVEGKFGYSDCFIGSSMDDLKIKLPSTPNGDPDWAYMESYMANLETKVAESLTLLQTAKDAKKKEVDTREWGEFRVGKLFDIHPTKAYKCTNAELLDNGETNVVVNSAYNNGVRGLSTLKPTEQGNMITFSDTVDANTIFYQDKPFIGYPHVQGLYPIGIFRKNWTELSLKYFATVFRQKALSIGFDYGNKFRRDIAVKLHVLLPVDKTGQPDWAYMEEYMRKVGKRTENMLNQFVSAKKDCENER